MSFPRMAHGCLVCAALFIADAGCTKYYKVTDPTTGKVYYTEDVDRKSGGTATLEDARTGDKVTIQNSEVTEIKKEQFEAGKFAPEPAPAPAAPAEPKQPANPFQ